MFHMVTYTQIVDKKKGWDVVSDFTNMFINIIIQKALVLDHSHYSI